MTDRLDLRREVEAYLVQGRPGLPLPSPFGVLGRDCRLSGRRSWIMRWPIRRYGIVNCAWKMLDDDVCAVSSSSVYRVLSEAKWMCTWQPQRKAKGSGRPDAPTRPDQWWQTDIRYTKVAGRNYYLLSFLDVYARYIVHHELLRNMDGLSVSIAAAAALAILPAGGRPVIQSDHGSGFIAKEFVGVLAENNVTHQLIQPHTPTDNA